MIDRTQTFIPYLTCKEQTLVKNFIRQFNKRKSTTLDIIERRILNNLLDFQQELDKEEAREKLEVIDLT